jgi:putative restriction endonuclease
MRGFVGVTDNDWFFFLSKQPEIDEVNFWQPGGRTQFRALQPGEPFLFKLHKPYQNYIAGGGFFAHSTILPVSLAWQAFQEKNGAPSYLQMRRLIERKRNVSFQFEDYKIGCIILTQPFFFSREQWIPIPPDFSLNIVQGKTYDLSQGHGLHLWEQGQEILALVNQESTGDYSGVIDPAAGYGSPILVKPRLGQGSFRVMVTDAYERRCAITQEKILPALETAHIKPFKENGPHAVSNGLLLRSDIHRLFDSGYVTVTNDHRFEVSNRIKEEFDNGEHYRLFHGDKIYLPQTSQHKPSPEFLNWHNENVFRG